MNWLNISVILVMAWVLIFVQSAFNSLRELLGAQIDLLPALMVYTALSARLAGVTLVAIAGGLAFDALSANPTGDPQAHISLGHVRTVRRGARRHQHGVVDARLVGGRDGE